MDLFYVVFESIRGYLLPLIVIILGSIWYKTRQKDRHSIPGPKSWPLVGNALQIGFKPFITFMKWGNKYGPIIYLNLVKERMVVLNDLGTIKDLFNNPLTTGRETGTSPIFYEMCQGAYGVINSDGDSWDAQRRFTLKTLREYGFEKSSIEKSIMIEVTAMVNWLRQRDGIVIEGNQLFNGPLVNVIWTMVSSERCDWTSCEGSDALNKIQNFLNSIQKVTDSGLYFAPFLRFILPKQTGWTKFKKDCEGLTTMFKETVQRHREILDKSKPRDYIDCYLKEIEETDIENSSFYQLDGYRNLLGALFDMFMAGSTTTSSVMTWFLLCISHNQEIQKKIKTEIEQVVGLSRLPSLSDRKKMPYTEAVIMETLRFGSVTPLGGPHRAISDISYNDYVITKDTTIIANLYGINNNPHIWGDPEKFRPERFLEKGRNSSVEKREVLAFSSGKRKCIGERLAKNELFLFITGLIKAFKILPEDEEKLGDFEGETGLFIREPKPFKVLFKEN